MRGLIAAFGVATAFALAPATASAQEEVSDPFEGFNRHMFAVHEAIDHAVLEPVARGYRAITPSPVRTGVRSFLRNLRSPVIFANDVLQGEFGRAGTTAARFGINSTIGIGGVFDPATTMGLERHDEDFGQTLGRWGVPSGPYLFIPLLGPTNFRDGVGIPVDIALDPINYAEFDGDNAFRISRAVIGGVSAREDVLDAMQDIRQDSLDPYVTIRTSYGLWRYSAIQNGRRDVQDLPDFEAIPEDPVMQQEPGPEGDAASSEQPPVETVTTPPGETESTSGDHQ